MTAIASLFSYLHRPPRLIFRIRRNPKPQSIHSNSISMGDQEVEVKIKLTDSHSHHKLTSILSPYLVATHLQENLFFDSPSDDLATRSSALRLRFYDSDIRAVLSLKSAPTIYSGVSRSLELQLEVDPLVARSCVSDPGLLGRIGPTQPNPVIQRVREIVGYDEDGAGFDNWVCLGGFRNVRNVFDWKGLKLEVDETLFDFGTNYEVECESDTPLDAKALIEELLISNRIPFSYSKASKFAVFRAGRLPP